jgi:hypothetical protein
MQHKTPLSMGMLSGVFALHYLPGSAPESPCDSYMGMKGAFLLGVRARGNILEQTLLT